MPNANARIPETRQGCKRATCAEWLADFHEFSEDEEFAEDCIHHALNEGVIDYATAYRLRAGEL